MKKKHELGNILVIALTLILFAIALFATGFTKDSIVRKPRLEFGLGFTAKIRDAKIALSSPGLRSEKTNVGFVPIINFRVLWKIDDKFGLLLDGDALAAPQGRAEDVLIAATYKLSDNFGIRAGYRILEGCADNEEVYNFALFHFASFGISYTFFKKQSQINSNKTI